MTKKTLSKYKTLGIANAIPSVEPMTLRNVWDIWQTACEGVPPFRGWQQGDVASIFADCFSADTPLNKLAIIIVHLYRVFPRIW